VFSGQTAYLWIYLVAPILGAALGAGAQHLLIRRMHARRPQTYKMCG
jgi:glycerol uptake facilitator protein/aquaporin Z